MGWLLSEHPMILRNSISALLLTVCASAAPVEVSGIYPHLAAFNDEGECGTGAVVPWADRLWVVTYAPHSPKGSTDKLYEITPDLEQIVRPESIGGTPANRMIHRESKQLFLGSYVIGADRRVRVIPFADMYGRLTGNARHLTDPANRIYYATMEEGIYEVDVRTLGVTELWRDEQLKGGRHSGLPGYHGKGLYSGQGVLVYANNGERGRAAETRFDTPSGVLAEWDGKADAWTVVRRNQFTEVTGPGGITGNPAPATDPVWTMGWDQRSLLLGVRAPDSGWTFYRLPKGSHSYDGAHGWNTEWPRIREIGEGDFLMTMHGTFWKFPRGFKPGNAAGIRPRSNYLKVIGDFCRWQDRVVFGCDDTAKNEFLNKRKAKGEIAGPQSQSNLWFVEPSKLDALGPVIGRGAVWLNEAVRKGAPSDAYLLAGYGHRGVHLAHDSAETVEFALEVDDRGDGKWRLLANLPVPPGTGAFHAIDAAERGEWVRVTASRDCAKASAVFIYRNSDPRGDEPSGMFDGLAKPGDQKATGGLVRSRPDNKRTLALAAIDAKGGDIGYYELGADLKLNRVEDAAAHSYQKSHTAIPRGALTVDAASAVFTDDDGKRWRLPKGAAEFDGGGTFGSYRLAREVATERDFFNAHGTVYELPANNAGGFARVRAVATHGRMIHDFCSYRGMLVMSGIAADAPAGNPHIIRSNDGKTALWVGAVDDAWQLGKPRGTGGPWFDSAVTAGQASDPYLMTGYDRKSLVLTSDRDTTVTAEVELAGDGLWVVHRKFEVKAGKPLKYEFPPAFSAYWIRFTAADNCKAGAVLEYR